MSHGRKLRASDGCLTGLLANGLRVCILGKNLLKDADNFHEKWIFVGKYRIHALR